MKLSHSLIASAVLLATSSIALAATDSTTINIDVTEDAFVTLIGTALTQSNNFTVAQMDTVNVSLGSLGFDSNVTGTCTVTFDSTNNFQLLHSVTSALLDDYQVDYNGATITVNAANTVNQDCLTATASAFTMASINDISATSPPAGSYTDSIQITVTTP